MTAKMCQKMARYDVRLNLLKIKCRSYDLTYHCTWTQHLTSRDTLEIKYLLEVGLQLRISLHTLNIP